MRARRRRDSAQGPGGRPTLQSGNPWHHTLLIRLEQALSAHIRRRKLLVSSFACSPVLGSEPGVGWHWVTEMARRHDVVVVTRTFFKPHIEPELAARPVPGLRVSYFDPPGSVGIAYAQQMFSRRYYMWWQWHVRRHVQQLLAAERFDLIHHLTWGTFRWPLFISDLGVPMVMGPVGGGERGPLGLLAGLPLRAQLFDWLRDVTLRISSSEWLAPQALKRARLVLCKTAETMQALPPSVRPRAVIAHEIGAPEPDPVGPVRPPLAGRPLRLLFAGRLMGWKGVALAVGAVAELRKLGHEATLDIAGEGPLEGYLRQQISQLGLGAQVRLLGMLPKSEVLRLYSQSDLFVFPSLHDSSGNVVLESLSRGLPVVCLDVGGPPQYIQPGCGAVVATAGRTRQQVERALAEAMAALVQGSVQGPAQTAAMAEAAMRSVQAHTWAAHVDSAYELIEREMGWA
jgi:glycosyltransferase involved in cell wall biosynthesis